MQHSLWHDSVLEDVSCDSCDRVTKILIILLTFAPSDRANRIFGHRISLKQLQCIARTCSNEELNLDLTKLPSKDTDAAKCPTQADPAPRMVQNHFEILCT